MATPRNDNVKENIMLSTEKLIDKYEIKNVTLAKIASEANISKGTLYYYYKSKEEILLEITERFLIKQMNDLEIWTNNKNKNTSFHRLIMYILQRAVLNSAVRMHITYNAMQGNELIQKKLIELYNSFAKEIAKKVSERVDNVDSDFVAWLILTISDGINIQKHIYNEKFDSTQFINKIQNYSKLFE